MTPRGRVVALVIATLQALGATFLAVLERGYVAPVAAGSLACVLALAWVLFRPRPSALAPFAEAAERVAHGERGVHVSPDATGDPEARRLVAAFNRMTDALAVAEKRSRRAERLAAWRDIARQMAHEIKNPLTPIRLAVESLRKARTRDPALFEEMFDEETAIVLEEVERLRRLLDAFSQFARMPRPRPEPVDVGELLRHAVELHRGSSAAVRCEAPADLPPLRADRDQLTQVLLNLVGNAVFAAEERAANDPSRGPAWVRVAAEYPGERALRVVVEDNGGGIDETVMARLYEPYVTTRQGRGGTGLGLAIAYRIVTEHQGTMAVDTGPAGTRFTLDLPLAGPVLTLGDSTLG
ncbi:MAG: Nitrogen regulation protein ntrY [Myxococcaceae bacterium]|nr:Nitrogen regulation protein ntrY [Myxococcaceae bacterium]